MKSITINLPDNVELTEKEAAMILAAKLYDMEILTMGRAAEVAGISKREFMETVGKYGVETFKYTIEDLKHDIDVVRHHRI
jgi:predicted HTH domain antitoxin